MEFVNKEDQDQEGDQEEEEDVVITSKLISSSSSHNSNNTISNYGSPSSNHTIPIFPPPLHQYQQKPWLAGSPEAAINFMDLSLNKDNQAGDEANQTDPNCWPPNIEKEHMFDKVVTPSDVGKLNRLVIPKQHAERYFPLDTTANEKGLILNFQDRTGKPWRFRYSYWNSSQSYVMTKGWSRFVKEKRLDAGDIVSFERGVGEAGKDCLYIDWKRRPPPPPPPPHHYGQFGWGGGGTTSRRLYSMLSQPPSPMMSMPLRHHEHFHHPSNNYHHPYYHQHHQTMNHQYYHHPPQIEMIQGGRDFNIHHQYQYQYQNQYPKVFDSVPFVEHGRMMNTSSDHQASGSGSSTGKRLRLFGVNMETSCPNNEEDDHQQTDHNNVHEYHQILSSTAIPHGHQLHHQHCLPSSSISGPNELRLSNIAGTQQKKEKSSTSLSFYLDP